MTAVNVALVSLTTGPAQASPPPGPAPSVVNGPSATARAGLLGTLHVHPVQLVRVVSPYKAESPALSTPVGPTSGTAPPSPPVRVCGNAALLSGPSTPPAGAVIVPAGTDLSIKAKSPTTTYWFAPGIHTRGTTKLAQWHTGTHDTYLGAPGAVISGRGANDYAFTGGTQGVTIEHLTVVDFAAPAGQMVVNHTGSSKGWTIEYNTIETSTRGAGVGVNSGDLIEYNCLTHNAEYGFNGFGRATTFTLSRNEISYNDGSTAGGGMYDQGGTTIGCGCSGGGKFWDSRNGTVTTNWVHDNGSVGIWADTDNRGFDISGNYITHNYAEAVIYEISYNALIADNTLVANGWGKGPKLGGFPLSAVYISESGGDSRVTSFEKGTLQVTGNVLKTNWGGVVLWENANRYCGDGSDHYCTLVTPATDTITLCKAHLTTSTPTQTPDYYDNCRWRTKTVLVTHNRFSFTSTRIPNCTVTRWCGFNGLFSQYGSRTPWTGWIEPFRISNTQNNHFEANSYSGPWHFDGFKQGDQVTWTQWTKGFTDWHGSYDHFTGQDAGSSDS